MRAAFLGVWLLLGAASVSGCSGEGMRARWALFRAEQLFWKTHVTMKSQKIAFQKRKPFYGQACDLYLQAFRLQPGLFHGARIEEASLTCSNAGNREASEELEGFYEAYCKQHPKECEYGGDMGAAVWVE